MIQNILDKLKNNAAIRLIVILVGITTAFLTIYPFLIRDTVNLKYNILSSTNVLDLNTDLSKLDIGYDCKSIKVTNENLRILTVQIINDGTSNLTMDYYDKNDPLGIRLKAGKIIEAPEIISTSNDYLKKNLKLFYNDSIVLFPQVIIEPQENFTVKLLVLHKRNVIPHISAIGKVAGQKHIRTFYENESRKELSIWSAAFKGNLLVQLLRFIVYLSLNLILIISLLILLSWIIAFKKNLPKQQIINKFKKKHNNIMPYGSDKLFIYYKEFGSPKLWTFKSRLEKIDAIKRIDVLFNRTESEIYFDMLNCNLVIEKDDEYVVNVPMKYFLIDFIDFIKANQKKSKKLSSNRPT